MTYESSYGGVSAVEEVLQKLLSVVISNECSLGNVANPVSADSLNLTEIERNRLFVENGWSGKPYSNL